MIGLELSLVPGTYVHVTIMSGLELLTNSSIVGTICYEASDWQGPVEGLERQTRSEVKAERIGGGELVHLTAASLTQDTCVGCEVRLISGLPGGLDTCSTEFVTPAPNYLLSSLTALSHALKEQRDCQFWTCR